LYALPTQAQEAEPAQQEYGALKEVLVTAQRREESQKDVPVSITAFSAESIEKLRLESLGDYAKLTPNLGYFTEGNTLSQVIAIRGVTNLGGYVNSLAVYVDEFNVTPGRAAASYEQSLFDLDRIEVLRGPQGVFFGRNVIGGAIVQTTTKPANRTEASVTAEYGNFGTWQARGMVNLPLAANKAALRLTGMRSESDGFIKDVGPGHNTNDYDTTGGRAALRLMPTGDLTIDLAASHVERNQGIDTVVPTGQLFPVQVLLGVTPIDDGQGFYPRNRDKIATNTPTSSSNDTDIVTSRVQWDASTFSLISVSGYLKNKASSVGDADMSIGNFAVAAPRQRFEGYSTELRAQSRDAQHVRWVIGASFGKDKSDFHHSKTLFADYYSLFHLGALGLPDPFPAPSAAVQLESSDEHTETRSTGVFGNNDWTNAAENLTLSIGARFSHDEVGHGSSNRSENLFTGQPDTTPATSGTASFDDVSPRVSAVFKLTPETNLYASVAKGYKPGGFNNFSLLTPQVPATFGPERALNYETGVKASLFDARLRANLAIFYMKWKAIQVDAAFVDPATFVPTHYIANGAAASSRGAELDLAAQLASHLTLEAGVGYDSAKFDSFANALDLTGRPFDAGGNVLPLAPKWTTNTALQYTFGISGQKHIYVRAEHVYRSLAYTSFDAIPLLFDNVARLGGSVPAYHTWAARIGLEGGNFRIAAYLENVTDANYVIGGRLDNYTSGNPVVVSPRRYGVRVTYDFF
jgi:iron complex outermembrane receptor protein